MDQGTLARSAVDRLSAGDVDGFLQLGTEKTKFFIGGRTKISGDHDVESFRRVASNLAVEEGRLRRDVIGVAIGGEGEWADVLVHDYVTTRGIDRDYHAVLEFQIESEKISYFWIYVHEFDAFADAWS